MDRSLGLVDNSALGHRNCRCGVRGWNRGPEATPATNQGKPRCFAPSSSLPSGGVWVYEITIDGGGDALKESIARMLCPDEDHPPPCPVPWSFGYREAALVLAVYASASAAAEVAERVRVLTPHPVALAEGDAADHDELVQQYRIENAPHERCR
jgi:hypothetical protein